MDDEEKEILYRLDERTEQTNEAVKRMEKRLDRQDQRITNTNRLAKSNENKINTGAFLGGSAITALFTWVAGILPV